MAHYETEQVFRITVKSTETAGVEIIPTEEGIEILFTKRTLAEDRKSVSKEGKNKDGGKTNMERLVEFCRDMKEKGGGSSEELKKFYHWYAPRMEEWKGTVQPEKLWKRWEETR